MGYLTNFIVYMLAMVGVMMLALFIFKNATGSVKKGQSKFLKVHDTLSLGPRKTLYIVSAGQEKFLIAGDVDKTSLISKLQTTESPAEISFEEELAMQKPSYIDRKSLGIKTVQNKPYNSVMKNLAERIKG